MSMIVHVNQRRKRLEEAKQHRSDAINRTLRDAEFTITDLKAELFATRIAGVIAALALGTVLLTRTLECAL